jgi:pyruvate/2-oxoglutarate/acetoin dehydrogenase E1 component
MPRLGIAEALRAAIAEEMRLNDNVFCLGEDIGVPGGGRVHSHLGIGKGVP